VSQSLVCGWGCSFFIELNQVWAWGDNSFGQLGTGHDQKLSPVPTAIDQGVVQISSTFASLWIDDEYNLWSVGSNSFGQLGDGTRIPKNTPTLVNCPTSMIERVSVGLNFSVVLDQQGNVYTFGANNHGQLGNQTAGRINLVPTLIPCAIPIQSIATGQSHTLMLDQQQRVWSFGYNNRGQLGVGDLENRFIPTLIESLNCVNTVFSSHGDFSILMDDKNQLYGFGSNTDGQLGQVTALDYSDQPIPITMETLPMSVACGSKHTLVLDESANLWAMGCNTNYQLTNRLDLKPVPFWKRKKPEKKVFVPSKILHLPPILQVAAGGNHSMALDFEGYLWAWGR
jgi:alpha-tubulin suppressor-like RCC1 family protein